MRLPRIRLTVRRLMLAVAVVALVIWLGRIYQLRQMYLEKVLDNKVALRQLDSGISCYTEDHTNWHEAMKQKYEHAARHPWLPVEPDPPYPNDSHSHEQLPYRLITARSSN
jgi:hypothetical protein